MRMKRAFILLSIFMVFFVFVKAQAQTKQVQGNIKDENGEGLPGVSVYLKGTTTGSVSDVNGDYNVEVPDNTDVLVFSYIGYKTREVSIGQQTQIDLAMEPDLKTLSEVIVVGYGSMKKSDITGAVASVTGESLSETPATNFIEQAQGRLAGVDIVRSNGAPGAGSQIRIRGNRSITASNEPLFVIDGIPTTQGLDDFNPNDIESMEVLKDASAVAIYGSRGANGVILITTKKGIKGKPVVNYNSYYGTKKAVENIDLMNGTQYAEFVRVANGLAKDDTSLDVQAMGAELVDNLNNGIYTDWLDEVLSPGSQTEHQLSVSGANDQINYYLSGGYYDEMGVIKKSDFERFSVKANFDIKVSEKLKVGISSTISTDLRNRMSNSVFDNALRYNPLALPYDADGNIIPYPNPNEGLVTSPLLNYAPLQYVDETRGYRYFTNLYGEYAIREDLKYRLNFGSDMATSKRGQYDGDLAGGSKSGEIRSNNSFAYTLEHILTFDKQFNDHGLNVVGLFSVQNSKSEFSELSARDIPIAKSTFNDLGSAGTITGINSGFSEWGLLSYMGRVNYQYKGKYLLTASGRADGSSRLAEGNKWSFFPAASVGWIISAENFMESAPFSFLKMRMGYGEVGNTSISPYQTLGGLERSIYAFGSAGAFGYGNALIPNPDLRWETSKSLNLGVDFGFMDDRVTGTLELYSTKTTDLLLERYLPITSGYASILQNIGSTSNKGIELTVSTVVLENKDGLNWDVELNVFSNKEEIVELFNGQADDVGNRWFIGEPINVFYDYQFDGIWQTSEQDAATANNQRPGDIRIADVNGRDANGELTKQADGSINVDDRTVLGSTVPKWSGGLNNRFSYKAFDLSVMIYTRQGHMINSGYHNLGGNAWEGRHSALNFDYWTPTNPNNEIPMPRAGGQPLYASALRFHDASFVKIKNITLGYNVDDNLVSKLKINALRLYVAASNPFIFSPFDVVDPETSNGVVGGNSPLATKTFLLGAKVKF
ncbi:MAG: TonB-dependent receptor [Cyclobacteriaceae bacterium]|nr:TonB-dependent receptor [Cyclobacteriaceae bacterium]